MFKYSGNPVIQLSIPFAPTKSISYANIVFYKYLKIICLFIKQQYKYKKNAS